MSTPTTRRVNAPHSPTVTKDDLHQEDSPLLPQPKSSSYDSGDKNENTSQDSNDPTAIYARVLAEHLPWYKRPTAMWLIPIFGLVAVTGGMMTSSIGQFHASLLCREYLNHHTPTNATLAAIIEAAKASPGGLTQFLFDSAGMEPSGMMAPLRPAPECLAPEIQAYTAKVLAVAEVLGAVTGSLSIGYYTSLSDKYGRARVMSVSSVNTLWVLLALILQGKFWDQVGLALLIASSFVGGILGGWGLGMTLTLAYAADCTDPSKRSLAYSWLHAALFFGLAVG
ncbi:hypothetical protein BGZ94_005378 [Podila epigama]|nr:hypothetical protein BGZ94_005378 [Podila epigama]